MTRSLVSVSVEQVQLLGDDGLSLLELARCCRVSAEWLSARVEAGVLQPRQGRASGDWRFDTIVVQRVRRLQQLEHTYDADPQLAALATDLMEEVAWLRRQLRLLSVG